MEKFQEKPIKKIDKNITLLGRKSELHYRYYRIKKKKTYLEVFWKTSTFWKNKERPKQIYNSDTERKNKYKESIHFKEIKYKIKNLLTKTTLNPDDSSVSSKIIFNKSGYMYNWFILLYTRNSHNTVNQLCSNKK